MGIGKLRGDSLYLTIDHQLQMKAYEMMSSYRGAAVVLDPRTGEILAMVSTPSYDPNNDSFGKHGINCVKMKTVPCGTGLPWDYIGGVYHENRHCCCGG